MVFYLLVFNLAMALFQIRPFWNDEWRLIYNLKFKSTSQLWGRLDLLQECPRLYLTVLKQFTSWFDYSYTSLRLPAFIIGVINVIFIFNLRKKLLPGKAVYSYLFALIVISSQTFTDYMVQVKQYEVDIFCCLVAVWQLITLLNLSEGGLKNKKQRYLLLCLSFSAIPFFSYTYPIAIAPVYAIVALRALVDKKDAPKGVSLIRLVLPLMIAAVSIAVFYLIDAKNLIADKAMYRSYLHMMGNDAGEKHYALDFWNLFALVGSGFVYEIVFGILGIAAFLYSIYRLAITKRQKYTQETYLLLYAVLLVVLTMGLFVSGKLLGSVARLTVYTVPSIAFIIVILLKQLKEQLINNRVINIIALGLFLGLAGNIITTCINNFTYPEYKGRMQAYEQTAKALEEARDNKIPLLYTTGIAADEIKPIKDATHPGIISFNTITQEQIAGADVLCAEVIVKVNPAYKVWDTLPLYEIPDTKWLNNYIQQLPTECRSVIVCDGIHVMKMKRQ